MKRFLKILRIIAISLVGIFLLLTISVSLFVAMSPQFGGTPEDAAVKVFAASAAFEDGKFQNQVPTSMDMSFSEMVSVAWKFLFSKPPGREPDGPLPVQTIDSASVASRATDLARLTWFGHSACLLEIDGKKVFIDPMLGQFAGPLPALSPRRFNEALPIAIEALPYLDAVIISHDHYDHLDYGSIVQMKDRVGHFFVPLAVGAHLISWGVAPEKITELNWWEEAQYEGFTFICAPARHFSGRGFTRNETLWASWVIQSSSQRFYFSGDSGYGPHFEEIGRRYGPFDLAMLECGQYNERWIDIHMMPEQTVQAALDVRAKLLLPIHWGAFPLALHTWTDPITRVATEAARRDVLLTSPLIGEPVMLDYQTVPRTKWWQ